MTADPVSVEDQGPVPFETVRPMPRMGVGIRWADITAQIAADRAEPSPDPLEAA